LSWYLYYLSWVVAGIVLHCLSWWVVVRIVDHHCLNFHFIFALSGMTYVRSVLVLVYFIHSCYFRSIFFFGNISSCPLWYYF
jgi:hypothetical protein